MTQRTTSISTTPPRRPGWARRVWSAAAGIIGRVVLVATVVVLVGVTLLSLLTRYYIREGTMLPEERVDAIAYPDQGWGEGVNAPGRQTYYYTAQGAGLKDLRYSWFVNLEMPWSNGWRVAEPAVLSRYGFVVDPPSEKNPDALPVGFAKHFDAELNEEMLDITCAACHTGQVTFTKDGRTTAFRVDGGSALHAFTNTSTGHFAPTLVASLAATSVNPFKFVRFAKKVLPRYPEGRMQLHRQMRSVIGKFGAMAWHEKTMGLIPTEEGYGRTDALARIANTVFGDNVDTANYRIGNGPVNYPPVWNIWKFDWVQYNASVKQPMARNIGESMGTGAKYALVDRYGNPLPPDQRFKSTTMLENLHQIEVTLRGLRPPAWPENLLGPVDGAKAARGKELFATHCQGCHGPHIAPPALKARNAPLKTLTDPEWVMKTVCVADIGTDPNTAANFANANANMDITRTGLTEQDLQALAALTRTRSDQRNQTYDTALASMIVELTAAPPTEDSAKQIASFEAERARVATYSAAWPTDPKNIPVGVALSYLGSMIREKAYNDLHYTAEEQSDLDGYGILDTPQIIAGYKPRPLAGIWASPPFLHNGSVPTIYDLLSPVAERPRTFLVGSRGYDYVKLGLATPNQEGFWEFKTELEGNHNTGHEFSARYREWKEGDPPADGSIGPLLSHDDRLAIIEHLKVRNDDVDGYQKAYIPSSETCAVPAAGPKPRTLWQRLTFSSR